jgi:hypothetical protein
MQMARNPLGTAAKANSWIFFVYLRHMACPSFLGKPYRFIAEDSATNRTGEGARSGLYPPFGKPMVNGYYGDYHWKENNEQNACQDNRQAETKSSDRLRNPHPRSFKTP